MSDDRHDHDDLEANVLGALDAREREAFEVHLATCATCVYERAAYANTLQSLTKRACPLHRRHHSWTDARSPEIIIAHVPFSEPLLLRRSRSDSRLHASYATNAANEAMPRS